VRPSRESGPKHRNGALDGSRRTPQQHSKLWPLKPRKNGCVSRTAKGRKPRQGKFPMCCPPAIWKAMLLVAWGSTLGSIPPALKAQRAKGLRSCPASAISESASVESRRYPSSAYKKISCRELHMGPLVRVLRQRFLWIGRSQPRFRDGRSRQLMLEQKIEEMWNSRESTMGTATLPPPLTKKDLQNRPGSAWCPAAATTRFSPVRQFPRNPHQERKFRHRLPRCWFSRFPVLNETPMASITIHGRPPRWPRPQRPEV